jgi:hypothetical protein
MPEDPVDRDGTGSAILQRESGVLVRYGSDLADDAAAAISFPPNFRHECCLDGQIPGGPLRDGRARRLLDGTVPPSCVATARRR